VIHFNCQDYAEPLEAPVSLLGDRLGCPRCGLDNVVSPACVVENNGEAQSGRHWVVERLLYPASVDGLVCIGLVWGVPLLVNLIKKRKPPALPVSIPKALPFPAYLWYRFS
jgi:hypothetical protein